MTPARTSERTGPEWVSGNLERCVNLDDCVIRTWCEPAWDHAQLLAYKQAHATAISVVLPALNEAATIGGVIETIRPFVGGLVDELVVVDSGSTDDTINLAQRAGARVITREQIFPHLRPQPGKGEVLWRSLAATSGDLVVFMDSDLTNPDPSFVPNLVGPLLEFPEICLVKGFYRRPLTINGQEYSHGGGRVTELVARPLLAALQPDLGGIVQPLAGEYAARRDLLEAIPFAPGYGVDIGVVLDTYFHRGTQGIAQVNLGVRKHRNRELDELAIMSRQIIATIFDRCQITDSGVGISQYRDDHQGSCLVTTPLLVGNRPPIGTVVSQHT